MKIVLFILAMSVVNNVPRILPYFYKGKRKIPLFVRKCMALLPLSSLGALIFPSVIFDYSGNTDAAVFGLIAAFLSSFLFKVPLIVPIILSVSVTALFLLF